MTFPPVSCIIHNIYLQDLYNIVRNGLKRIELKKLATVTHYYTFTDYEGKQYRLPIDICKQEQEKVLKQMNLSSISKLTSEDKQKEFYTLLAQETHNKKCRHTIEIKSNTNIFYSYKEEDLERIYSDFLDTYRSKLEQKLEEFNHHLLLKDVKDKLIPCVI